MSIAFTPELVAVVAAMAIVAGSIGAGVPAVLGVRVGVRVRDRIREALRRGVVLWLLAEIGVRLVLDGFAAI